MSDEFRKFIELIGTENYGSAYDFIANTYYRMSKEELKSICLEALYAMYYCLDHYDEERCYQSMYDELFQQNLVD